MCWPFCQRGLGRGGPRGLSQPVRSTDQGPACKWQNQVLNPQLLPMNFMSFPDSTSGKRITPTCPDALGRHILYPAPPALRLLDTGSGLCNSLGIPHAPCGTPSPRQPRGFQRVLREGRDRANLTSPPTSSSSPLRAEYRRRLPCSLAHLDTSLSRCPLSAWLRVRSERAALRHWRVLVFEEG